MKTFFRVFGSAVLCFYLSSCWIPEQFTAVLNVDKEQNYKFTYDGTIAFAPALERIKEHGPLSSEDDAKMIRGADDLKKHPEFKSVEYVGGGRFKVHYEESGVIKADKKIFVDLIEFKIGADGKIWILGANITDETRHNLSQVDLKLDGLLKINTDLSVVQNNASSTPHTGGVIGSYEWHITSAQLIRPTMVLQSISKASSLASPSEEQAIEEGLDHDSKGEWDQAIESFNKAASIDPSNFLVILFRANTYELKGDYRNSNLDMKESQRLLLQEHQAARDPLFAPVANLTGKVIRETSQIRLGMNYQMISSNLIRDIQASAIDADGSVTDQKLIDLLSGVGIPITINGKTINNPSITISKTRVEALPDIKINPDSPEMYKRDIRYLLKDEQWMLGEVAKAKDQELSVEKLVESLLAVAKTDQAAQNIVTKYGIKKTSPNPVPNSN